MGCRLSPTVAGKTGGSMTMAPLGTPVAVSIVGAVGVVVVATVGTLVATVVAVLVAGVALMAAVVVAVLVLVVLMATAVPVLVLATVAGELTAVGAGTRIVATSAAARPPAQQRATAVNVVIGAPP